MRFCPYCGASVDEVFSFCMKCGKKIPYHAAEEKVSDEKDIESGEDNQRDKQIGTSHRRKRKHIILRKKEKVENRQDAEVPHSSVDDGYDGYYDDVIPPDAGQMREEIDAGLIKKVVILVSVALLVIALCVLLMYLF